MNNKWKKELGHLFASLDEKEVGELLQEILTPTEYEEVVLRWQIVKMLIEGKPQREIRDKLHVSVATITRGSRELKYGKGSFHKFYERLKKSGSI